MLPNFLCIGAQKSGTTSIGLILEAHPDVCMSRPRETRFFSDAASFAAGMGEYERRCFGHWSGEAAVGEKCPEYLCEPSVAQRIRGALGPAIRFVIALRSPARRAHSHYRHNRARLRECRTFEAAISAELQSEAGGERVPASHAYLARGRYASQLERYRAVFGSEQLLLLRFETEIATDQQALAARLYDFLGVAPYRPEGLPFRAGHPPLTEVSARFDTTHPDSHRHFVEIKRPRAASRWRRVWPFSVCGPGSSRERVYQPEAALREFAERFFATSGDEEPLSPLLEVELNNCHFRDDIERLRALVPFDPECWLNEQGTGEPLS